MILVVKNPALPGQVFTDYLDWMFQKPSSITRQLGLERIHHVFHPRPMFIGGTFFAAASRALGKFGAALIDGGRRLRALLAIA